MVTTPAVIIGWNLHVRCSLPLGSQKLETTREVLFMPLLETFQVDLGGGTVGKRERWTGVSFLVIYQGSALAASKLGGFIPAFPYLACLVRTAILTLAISPGIILC